MTASPSASAWTPVWAMPNLTIDEPFEVSHLALVSCQDQRVRAVAQEHPNLNVFLKGFQNEFGSVVTPAIMMFRDDAPDSVKAIDAVGGFRDAVCVCAVTVGWARNLVWKRSVGVRFSDAFDVYPWFLVPKYTEHISAFTPAVAAIHSVSQLRPQPAPALGERGLSVSDIDNVLLKAISVSWERRFVAGSDTIEDRRLFRSLNMARAASKMPGGTDATIHDAGRAVALWVSAFEILAHDGRSDLGRVLKLFGRVQWVHPKLRSLDRTVIHHRQPLQTNLAGIIYDALYRARNAFLHGELVDSTTLKMPKCQRSPLLFAASLYRLALSAYLGLVDEVPPQMDSEHIGRFISRRIGFRYFQCLAEDAILISDEDAPKPN